MSTASGEPTSLMPAAFIGHGTPMNAIHPNRFTDAWRTFGQTVPRPRAVLCVSAHWFIDATVVTAMPHPRTIHDFGGFPADLYAVQYPAPGLPELAQEVADFVKPMRIGADRETWGLDHGSWAVLVRMFPDASVPVVELSVNAAEGLDYHFELGRRLAPLREQGVLVLASGQIVNGFRFADPRLEDGYAWAEDFDATARDILLSDPSDIGRLVRHSHFREAAPSPDHFWPLVQFAGLASTAPEQTDLLVGGVIGGSISMSCYTLGL